jgi:hypothetical protein
MYLSIKRAIKRTVVITGAYQFCQLRTKFYPTFCSQGVRRNRSTPEHIFCIRHILEKIWEYNEVVYQVFIDFKKAYYSVRMEVLHNILIEFGIPMKLVRLIQMCLTETYSRVRVCKNLSDMFPIR